MKSSRVVLLSVAIVNCLLAGTSAGAATVLLGLRTAVDQHATTFFLRMAAPVHYTPAWLGTKSFALDIAGASTQQSSDIQPLQSPLVSAYRIISYPGPDGEPHLRLEIALKEEAKVETQDASDGVEVRIHENNSPPAPSLNHPEATPTSQPSASHLPKGTAIREIQVAKLEGGSALEVEILGNGAFQYRTMRLSNPERLVLDIPDALNHIRRKQLPVNTPPLRTVRVGQLSLSPLVSRVVLDLDSKAPFQVRQQPDALVVTLGNSRAKGVGDSPAEKSTPSTGLRAPEPKETLLASNNIPSGPDRDGIGKEISIQGGLLQLPATKPAETQQQSHEENAVPASESSSALPPAEPSAPATPSAPPAQAEMNPQTGEKQPDGATRSPVAEPGPPAAPAASPAPPVHQVSPERLPQPAQSYLPESGAAANIQNASFSPAAPAAIETNSAPGNNNTTPTQSTTESLPAEPEPKVLLAQETTPPSTPAPPAPVPSAATVEVPPTPKTVYTGEPISVNLKDVDLKDFFRLIHEISGLNIVLDPGISGTVTIILDEVPWDQAMDIVMKNNGLDKEVEGNVVRIAKRETLEADVKKQNDLALEKQKAEPTTTVTRQLSYAKANDMIPVLKKFLTDRGDLIADIRTNTLIIRDIPGVIPVLDRLIRTLDQKSQQVEIEARVVSASRSFARDIGVQLAASGLTGNVVLGGTGLVGTSPINRGVAPPLFIGTPPVPVPGQPTPFANLPQPLAVNLPANGPTSGFSFLLTSGSNFALDAIITAAESKGIGKLLSRPKIITQNNIEATVKQGVKIPIQTTINNTISVQYVDVVLRLTVTPQITAEGTIFLKTDIENTSIDPGIATTPGQFGLDTQSAITNVLVSNGGTVFFGGVVQNINRVNVSEVPLLGSLPLLGNLFKHTTTTSTTNELLFFITPRIVQS